MAKKKQASLTIQELNDRMGDELLRFASYGDRELAIIGAAYLDDIIREMLRARFLDDHEEADAALNREFHNASRRITLAFLVGVIPAEFRNALRQVNSIRNKFAHHHVVTSFEDPAILEMTRQIIPRFLAKAFPDVAKRKDEGRYRFIHAVASLMVLLVNLHKVIRRITPPSDVEVVHSKARRGK